ncbi:outer membrane lipoprotein-sorting protein [Cloacibacterium sp. TD35]|uniref:outer membrane lipoprotein-sorting protein n=1 Tax=Cloacibacterium sp. TD35 TaxID=2976818 RepID=UPI00237E0174|nr:outer membrane lipoprotein-sorting protein [Cloacibacterium sp. TD35]WDT67564.1 outer membrane lipoprotein-sorting protein [Cloacibacterium sp. TD35]
MKKILLIVTILVTTIYSAQTAKQIIDKNIELTGGLTNWKLLNSIILQGKVILGVNDEYAMKIYQQRPNLTKTVVFIGNKENVIEGYDGKNGYAMNYVVNKLQVQKNYVPESFDTDFIDYENKGFTAQVLGKEKVGDRDCYKVELTKNVNKTIYYFDVQNFLLLKEEKKDETLVYSDFKKVSNLIMPYRIEATTPKKEGDYVMILYKIEVNKAFPANTFKF